MKGFVKTLESITAALFLLSVLSVIFFSSYTSQDWSDVSMRSAAYDSLNAFALTSSGMLRQNSPESAQRIYEAIDSFMQIPVKFLPTISGMPRPNIIIATDSESLRKTLETYVGSNESFLLGGINMSYILVYNQTVQPSSLSTEEKFKYDAMVFTGDISSYRDGAFEYADNGGTVVIWRSSPPSWVASELDISTGSGSSHSFSDEFDSYDLSRKFYFTPFYSYLTFRFTDLKYHGNVTLRNSVYDFTFDPNDLCLNYSGTCHYPGEIFSVGGEQVFYQNASGVDYVSLVIKNQNYVFSLPSSKSSGMCLVGSPTGCIVAGKRVGKGAIVWIQPFDISDSDFAQLMRAVVIWGASGINYLHPSYYLTPEIHDIRAPSVEKPFGSRKYVSASMLIPLQEWPVEMDLYVWSIY